MTNFDNKKCEDIFNKIFIDKKLDENLFENNFKINELDNTVTKQQKLKHYCDDFNQFFSKIQKLDIKHVCKNTDEFSVIGIVEFKDNTKKDLASRIKLDHLGKISDFNFFLVLHTESEVYGKQQSQETDQIELVKEYGKAFHNKHLEMNMYDPNGLLVCPVDSIPMSWYVNYNNFWWMNFVKAINIFATDYDEKSNVGTCGFDVIYYGVKEPLPHIQYLRFNEQNKIDCVRTYWNFPWAMELTKTNPVMAAVQTGDKLWMRKDIDLEKKQQLAREYWTPARVKEVLDFDPTLEHMIDTFKHLYRI